MAVATLSIDLEARLARLEGDLNRATATIDRQAQRMRNSFDDVGSSVKGLIAGLGAAASASFAVTFVKGAIDAADKLNDLSKKTGVAVDTLGGIGFAAGQAGGDLESAAAAVGKLNKSLAEAAAGDKQAAEAFNLLGVAIKNADGTTRSADAVLADLADRFASFDDGPEKAALALRIFGKAGADIIPLLDDGGRALQENIDYYKRFAGVTAEVASKADQFNDTIGKLQLLGGAFSRTLAAELLPALQATADSILAAKENSNAFSQAAGALRIVLETLLVTGATVKDVFVGLGDTLGAYAAVVTRVLAGDLAGAKAIGEAYRAAGEERRKALDAYTSAVLNPQRANTPALPEAPKGRAPRLLAGGTDNSADKAAEAYRRLAESIGLASAQAEEEILSGEKLSSLQQLRAKALLELTSGQYAFTEAQKASIRAGAEALQVLDDEVKAYKELRRVVDERAAFKARDYQAGNDAAAANDQATRDRLRSLLADTRAGQLKAATDEIRFLNEQFDQGKIDDVEQWADAVRNATSRLKPLQQETDDLAKTADSLGLTFASAFEDAIVGGKKFSEVLQSLEQDIIRILARKLVTEPIANFIGGEIKGFGNSPGGTNVISTFLSSLFGSAKGNAFGPGGVIPFANGGIVDRPTMFGFGGGRLGLMGEAGAEGVLPLKRGRNGKLGVIAQGGGGTVHNNYISVQAVPGMRPEDAMQQGVLIARGLQRALARNG